MIAAEKWYEYQENYQKYGFDMKPKQPRKKVKKKKSTVTAKDKVRLMVLTVIVGVVCIGLIITTAFAASIKYNTNRIIEENNALEAEIENLNVKIYSSNNIEAIEEKATKELGMVYPSSKQIVYLTENEKPDKGFADTLKEQAYN
ncbi:cell division protein FtsL [Anaerovorax odorimutans]|uniref:Cell division protein FtsL n=1 Tax=Anaerovorax odorimutans TaxID=109327 RepID=A0ABT1RPU6_9FIRM|nr:cell division protein FtsL [Anaerovorax odorimutans]MCQ4637200.1 cell division protein FtsL [Anaerovorax odorimutans]